MYSALMQEVKPTKKAESATAEVRVQHTPGPWKKAPSNFDNKIAVVSDADFPVAEVYAAKSSTELRQQIAEANARLIAAAPELLAACKRLVAITRNADAQQLKVAIAAIDKAEGSAL